jgi:Leucine-rich repeat (LRR) protein
MDLLDLSGNLISNIPDASASLAATELNLNRNQVRI